MCKGGINRKARFASCHHQHFNEEICMVEIGKNLADTLQLLGFLIMIVGIVYIVRNGIK